MITLPSLLFLPTIWIVDAQMGAGAHFADLPAAIAAAANGDTILVRAGTYSGFDLIAKGVTLRGEGATVTRIVSPSGTPAVRIVNATSAVVLSGLRVEGITAVTVVLSGVELLDCEVVGRGSPTATTGGIGLTVGSSALVVASRCTFVGGEAGASASASTTIVAGDAVRVSASASLGNGFVADQCWLRGGDALGVGGQHLGGRALNASGRARLDRCRCRGGDSSGAGGVAIEVTLGGEARVAGDGTSYVVGGLVGGGRAAAIRNVLANAIVHAPVGVVGTFDGLVQTGPELPRLQVDGVVRADGSFEAQQPVQVALDGLVPNGLGFVAFGMPSFLPPQAPFASELLVGGAGSLFLAAPLDAAGRLQFAYTPAAFGAVLVGVPVHLQGGVVSPTLGSVLTSNLDVHVALP